MESGGCCCKAPCLSEETKTCFTNFRKIITAMFVRILYMCYVAVILVAKLTGLNPQIQWIDGILIFGLVLMIAEAVYVNIKKQGQEGKWFTPSALFFLIAVVPSIYNMRLNFAEEFEGPLVLVQGAVIILVLGKWIAPKGNLSPNEHSQLLLVLMCAGADIVDVIGLESDVTDVAVKNVILAVSCWCAMQFCIVATAEKELPPLPTASDSCVEKLTDGISENENQTQSHESAAPSHNDVTIVCEEDDVEFFENGCCSCNYFCFYNEIWGTILNLILFEGPFLIVRVVLMAGGFVQIQSTIVFFAFKNFLSVLLSFNRIKVVIKNEYKPWKDHMNKVRRHNLRKVNNVHANDGRKASQDMEEIPSEKGTSLGQENPSIETIDL